jgi:hypothetical protein
MSVERSVLLSGWILEFGIINFEKHKAVSIITIEGRMRMFLISNPNFTSRLENWNLPK